MEKKPEFKIKKDEGIVAVPKDTITKMMDEIALLKKDRDMLLQVADKKSMSNYYQRHQGKIPTKVMLRTMMTREDPKIKDSPIVEKVVVGWKSTRDIPPEIDPATGRWRPEDQRCKLLFEDGTDSGEIYQAEFNRHYKQVEAEVIGRITDEKTENVVLKVRRLDNGKEYNLGTAYIN